MMLSSDFSIEIVQAKDSGKTLNIKDEDVVFRRGSMLTLSLTTTWLVRKLVLYAGTVEAVEWNFRQL